MKVAILLVYACAVLFARGVQTAAIQAPLDIITLDDLSTSDRKHLEYLDQEYERAKRSGSGDILGSIKSAIGQGIKNKLALVAKSSASASGHFSSSISGGSSAHHHYEAPPESYDHKSFDFWTLKKSILNTLLQAVKAIKGGVIAIKGQLIKGGGHLISAKGKFISSKGEAITNLGKSIAASAVLSPHTGHSATGHAEVEYGHYAHPSGPSPDVYHGSPSAPGPEYHSPEHYHHHEPHHYDDKIPTGAQAGILILKKIPNKGRQVGHEEAKIPDFKPLEPTGPSLGTIFNKFFSASSSLNPHEPTPFGAPPTGYESHHDEIYHDTPPPPSHSDHSLSSSHHELPNDYHISSPPVGSTSPTGHAEQPPPKEYLPSNIHPSNQPPSKPPSTNYGTPFEESDFQYRDKPSGGVFEEQPSYLNFDEFPEASKKSPNTIKVQTSPVTNPEQPVYQTKLPQPLSTQNYVENQNQYYKQPNEVINLETFPPYPSVFPTDFVAKHGHPTSPSDLSKLNYNFPPAPTGSLMPPSSTKFSNYHDQRTSASSGVQNRQPFSGVPPINQVPSMPTIKTYKHKNPQTLNVVQSISYELGPNGPKRLT